MRAQLSHSPRRGQLDARARAWLADAAAPTRASSAGGGAAPPGRGAAEGAARPERAPVRLRPPEPADAAPIWRLVRDGGELDLNSPYAYLLLCTDFAATSAVADAEGELLGFVGGYRPPPRPEALFVWQVGTAEAARGRGIASRLLDALVTRPVNRDVRFLEATVTPTNRASWALFRAFARRHGAHLAEGSGFEASWFPAAHEPEVRIRIGPLPDRHEEDA